MRVVVQRSDRAKCIVDNKVVGEINKGLVILVGFTKGDNEDILNYMARKIVNLRIFDDDDRVMNKNILDVDGEVLSISQFTLYADTRKGNRPSYINALGGDETSILYDKFNEILNSYIPVKTGVFGSDMKIEFTNDGPVTIMLEKESGANV